jgi:hypothetical protein
MNIRDKYLTEAPAGDLVVLKGTEANELEVAMDRLGDGDTSGELHKLSKWF